MLARTFVNGLQHNQMHFTNFILQKQLFIYFYVLIIRLYFPSKYLYIMMYCRYNLYSYLYSRIEHGVQHSSKICLAYYYVSLVLAKSKGVKIWKNREIWDLIWYNFLPSYSFMELIAYINPHYCSVYFHKCISLVTCIMWSQFH